MKKIFSIILATLGCLTFAQAQIPEKNKFSENKIIPAKPQPKDSINNDSLKTRPLVFQQPETKEVNPKDEMDTEGSADGGFTLPKKVTTVSRDELISSVLTRAIALYGALPQPHTLALYTEDRGELPDGQTVKEAGIKKREKVLLRPSTVKAG